MKNIFLAIAIFFAGGSIAQQTGHRTAAGILQQFLHPSPTRVLVAAHRGDWRNAPENSFHALILTLKMGADIMETDVRKTKDGVLVLMHDETINRTTSGKGLLSEWTWDSLQKVTLRQGHGGPTEEHIPAFERFMDTVKGKPILINLDKCWDIIPDVYAVLKKTGTVSQGLFKGVLPLSEMRKKFGNIMDSIHYIPMVVNSYADTLIPGFFQAYQPAGFELGFNKTSSPVFTKALAEVKEHHVTVWLNSLWPSLNAGHDDEKAMTDPDANWGWLINLGANVIQTDRPKELLEYLRNKKLHE